MCFNVPETHVIMRFNILVVSALAAMNQVVIATPITTPTPMSTADPTPGFKHKIGPKNPDILAGYISKYMITSYES